MVNLFFKMVLKEVFDEVTEEDIVIKDHNAVVVIHGIVFHKTAIKLCHYFFCPDFIVKLLIKNTKYSKYWNYSS